MDNCKTEGDLNKLYAENPIYALGKFSRLFQERKRDINDETF